jgi:hypothetical protein
VSLLEADFSQQAVLCLRGQVAVAHLHARHRQRLTQRHQYLQANRSSRCRVGLASTCQPTKPRAATQKQATTKRQLGRRGTRPRRRERQRRNPARLTPRPQANLHQSSGKPTKQQGRNSEAQPAHSQHNRRRGAVPSETSESPKQGNCQQPTPKSAERHSTFRWHQCASVPRRLVSRDTPSWNNSTVTTTTARGASACLLGFEQRVHEVVRSLIVERSYNNPRLPNVCGSAAAGVPQGNHVDHHARLAAEEQLKPHAATAAADNFSRS